VRRQIALLAAGAAAAVAVAHKLRRRRAPGASAPGPPPEPAPDPRADELREKLAAAREVLDERDVAEEHETPVDEAVAEGEVEARREAVHAQGRAAVAEMQADAPPADEP
jgi:hypothetical protein